MNFTIREMLKADIQAALLIWQSTPGIGLSRADSADNLELFLNRNPHLSFVAEDEQCLVGAVLCGHDGRRGFIYHLAVNQAYRRNGIGRNLVENCLKNLKNNHIEKCHIMVYGDNLKGQDFWREMGWEKREEIVLMSRSMR